MFNPAGVGGFGGWWFTTGDARGYQYAAPMGLRNEFLIRHDIYVVFRIPRDIVGFNPNVFSFG